METKVCKRCGRTLPIEEFYKHAQMADGHLSYCKDCTKKRISHKYMTDITDPEKHKKEMERGRDKYNRLYKNGTTGERAMAHPETRCVAKKFQAAGYDLTGKEIHHWNYNSLYDVFIMSKRLHACFHKYLEYDDTTKQFKYGGKLLTTKEEHLNAINEVIAKLPEEYKIDTTVSDVALQE